ncbi:MAG: hypothetical protein RJA70_2692 [Pseudomonadota bacterium]|jgi:aminotransferase
MARFFQQPPKNVNSSDPRGYGKLLVTVSTPNKLPQLASRMQFLTQSEIRRMTRDCAEKGGINLAQGLCDMEIPEVVRRAAQRAIDEGPNTYVSHLGLPELREILADKLVRLNAVSYDPATELIVTNGASGAFWAACLNLFDPGDEVVLFEPYYGYHLAHLRACGLPAKFVRLAPPTFEVTEAALLEQIGPKTRAIVVCTPGNPSGKVFTRSELEVIERVAVSHNLWVITDEIYEHFVYDGKKHISPASLPGIYPRCITIGGLSKTLSITGWRLGYCAAPSGVAERLALTSDLVYICAPSPLQAGAAAGLRALPDEYYAALARHQQDKRDRFCEALLTAGLTPIVPEGAYYVLADISKLPGTTARERASALLDQTGVAAVAGSAFYQPTGGGPGETLARFCFAKTDGVLDEACRRLETLR